LPAIPDLAAAFRTRLGVDPSRLDPADAFSQLIDACETEPIPGALPGNEDGDMLLFQYGTYDWGSGPRFDLDLTRQLVFAADDPDETEIWQLHLVYRYNPQPALTDLGRHYRWFHSPAEASAARAHIAASPALRVCQGQRPVEVAIEWEQT
jgi:hypothetical protein